MLKPVDCPYFYGDYHRGREIETCRLIERNRENQRPWRRGLCDTCPVPGILRQTTCRHLALEASVTRKLGLLDRVSVYAVCTEHIQELHDPLHCPDCEAGGRALPHEPVLRDQPPTSPRESPSGNLSINS